MTCVRLRCANRTYADSPQGASDLGKIASVLAHGEGLIAHARSAEYRIKK